MPRGVMAELVQPVLALHGPHSPQGGQRSRTSRPLPFFKNSLKKILFTIFFFFFTFQVCVKFILRKELLLLRSLSLIPAGRAHVPASQQKTLVACRALGGLR